MIPPSANPEAGLAEALVRTLRHEVGDLLQNLYATVAILQKRLPAEAEQERLMLQRLRTRGQACRQMFDSAHTLFCPLELAWESVDLAALAEKLAEQARVRFPQIQVTVQTSGSGVMQADFRRLTQLGEALLANACEAAKSCVTFETVAPKQKGQLEWRFRDDGQGVTPEHVAHLFEPFFTTKAGHGGFGLALAKKLAELHGGRLAAANLPAGGFEMCVSLPVSPSAGDGAN